MFYNNHFFRKPNVACFSIAKVMYRPKSNFHVFTKAEIRKNHLNLFRSTDRGGSRTAAAPKMEHFVIIVNGLNYLIEDTLLYDLKIGNNFR